MKNLPKFLCAACLAVAASSAHASTILYQYALVTGTVSEAGVSDLTRTTGTFSLADDGTGSLTLAPGETSLSSVLQSFQSAQFGFTQGLSGVVSPLEGDVPAFRVSFLLLEAITPPTAADPVSLLDANAPASTSTQTVPLASMPVPAGLPLLAAGLGVLGFVAHRRRRARKACA